MARDRLAARKAAGAAAGYQEPSLNAPSVPAQAAYQQPQQQQQQAPVALANTYAQQQSYTPVPGMGPAQGQAAYGAQQPQAYGQPQGYGQPMDAQYGQQDRYDAGGAQGGAVNGNGAVGGDFWSEVSVARGWEMTGAHSYRL